jgi:NAD(P)-dependent dehydrogenase (short-subunit alcohol dehydrogenase family)
MVDQMIAPGNLDHDASVAASAIPRLGRPDEIAAAVLWLCSPGASYITGSGFPLTVATPPPDRPTPTLPAELVNGNHSLSSLKVLIKS